MLLARSSTAITHNNNSYSLLQKINELAWDFGIYPFASGIEMDILTCGFVTWASSNNKLAIKTIQLNNRVELKQHQIFHNMQLFLDDSKMKNFTSCFKEKKFLEFFFKRIRLNKTGRYQDEFPYISLCGRERNYIRCDDVPIVYTHILSKGNPEVDFLTFGYAGELLLTQFLPEKIYMLPETGRVYHPAEDKYGGVGLIRSGLAIEISKNFTFEHGELHPPTHFNWKMKNFQLDQSWFSDMIHKHNIKIKSDTDL